MNFRSLTLRFSLIFLSLAGLVFLAKGFAGLPPLGPFFSPSQGFWHNSAVNLSPKNRGQMELEGLQSQVKILWDESGIPHIFAESDRDLYFAQGYLEASERLFQMDLITRVGSGQLAEWVGDRGLDLDRFFVGLGLRQAAQKALGVMMADEKTREALVAYSEGVNAFVDSLDYKIYPIEYKLLDVEPGRWSPDRTAAFLKMMSFRLAGLNHDLDLTRALQKLGADRVQQLFPDFVEPIEPVIHEGLGGPLAQAGGRAGPRDSNPQEVFVSAFNSFPDYFNPFRENGSNSWAVAPERSQTGRSLVANDTHLGFGLPGNWYELALVSPSQSVYGVSFAGTPGVMIGWTPSVSWAVTNGYSDVLDWYEVEFKSEDSSEEYYFEDEWWTTESFHEVIVSRSGKEIFLEQAWTHQGVVMHRQGKLGLVARWVPHRGSNELKTFLELNRAKTYADCRSAIQHFEAPSQNFICADQSQIGIFHQGRFPVRKKGQGRYIKDGLSKRSDWAGWLSAEELPRLESPQSGVLRSANQRPVTENFGNYFGWDFPPSYRARRISQLLDVNGTNTFSAQDLKQMQLDNLNLHAQAYLPLMLEILGAENSHSSLSPLSRKAAQKLGGWNYLDLAKSVEPSLFFFWWRNFEDLLWTPHLGERQDTLFPNLQRTGSLVAAVWQDKNHPDNQ